MLVGIHVRKFKTGLLQFADLRRNFDGNFAGIQAAAQRGMRESCQTILKLITIDQRGKIGRYARGRAIHQQDVAADAKPWILFCTRDGVIKGSAGGHQRGRGDYSARMGFGNGAVHAASESKIISVDDEAPRTHARSV